MDLELRERLEKLHDDVNEFITFFEEYEGEKEEDGEYEFLTDESGISNTDLDNFMEAMHVVNDFIEQLK